MATTPTTRRTNLARSHRLDIDTGSGAVNYEQLFGIQGMTLVEELRTVEDEMYEDAGAMRETNVGYSWRLELELAYSTNLAGDMIDSVHSFLRTQFKAHRTGRVENAEFGIRFYHRDGLDDGHSHEGRVYVKEWPLPGGKDRDLIEVVLQGQGKLEDIDNPAADLTPTVTGLDPATGSTGGGELVSIFGQHYMPNGSADVSAVDFGANPAADFNVVSDSRIEAVAPSGTGTVDVTVTTSNGTSANTSADDYEYV